MGLTLGTKVYNSHVVEQRSSALGRLWVMGLKEDGHGGTRSGDGFPSDCQGLLLFLELYYK